MPDVHGTVYASRRHGRVVHTDRDCPGLNQALAVREVDWAIYPNREVCEWCLGKVDAGPRKPRNGHSDGVDTCGTCGGSLSAEDRTACICDRYEEVMGPHA